jgi:hypothetical protein
MWHHVGLRTIYALHCALRPGLRTTPYYALHWTQAQAQQAGIGHRIKWHTMAHGQWQR